jgi:hypothetical protein
MQWAKGIGQEPGIYSGLGLAGVRSGKASSRVAGKDRGSSIYGGAVTVLPDDSAAAFSTHRVPPCHMTAGLLCCNSAAHTRHTLSPVKSITY